MFGLAFWDRQEQRLTLARDHFGIKPRLHRPRRRAGRDRRRDAAGRGPPLRERDHPDPPERPLREEGQRPVGLSLPPLPRARGRHRDVLRRHRAAGPRRDAHRRRDRHPAAHVHPAEGRAPRAGRGAAPLRRRGGGRVQAPARRVGAPAAAVGGARRHVAVGGPGLERGRGHHQPAPQRGRRGVDALGRRPAEHLLGRLPRVDQRRGALRRRGPPDLHGDTSTRTRSVRRPTTSRPTSSSSSGPRRSRSSPPARTRSTR